MTIYVYDTAAHARRAYDDACDQCSHRQITQGIAVKYAQLTGERTPTVAEITTCRNVYVAVVTAGVGVGVPQLGHDAGQVAGAIYRKAMTLGMSPCSERRA